MYTPTVAEESAELVEEGRHKSKLFWALLAVLVSYLMATNPIPSAVLVTVPVSSPADYFKIVRGTPKNGGGEPDPKSPTCLCTNPTPQKLGSFASLKRSSAAWDQSFDRNFCSALRNLQNVPEQWPPWLRSSGGQGIVNYPPSPRPMRTITVDVNTKLFFICDAFSIAEKATFSSFSNTYLPAVTLLSPATLAEFARSTLADRLSTNLGVTWQNTLFTYAYDIDRPLFSNLGIRGAGSPPNLFFDVQTRNESTNTPAIDFQWYWLARLLNIPFTFPQVQDAFGAMLLIPKSFLAIFCSLSWGALLSEYLVNA